LETVSFQKFVEEYIYNYQYEYLKEPEPQAVLNRYKNAEQARLDTNPSTNEDDEKEDKTKLLALIVYQADRLKTELIAYTPVWGWWAEGKKLWTHPLPAYRNPTVLLKIMWQTVNLPFMDEKDTRFKGGQYYGENKLRVWINQMIPFANHLQRWDHLEKSARYYKLWNF